MPGSSAEMFTQAPGYRPAPVWRRYWAKRL